MRTNIRTEDIIKSFGRLVVLKQITVQIAAGQSVALLGRNGAGKSTLLRILSTQIKPTSGDVWIQEHNIRENPSRCRSLIGMISHHTFIYDDLTPQQNLEFYAKLYGISNRGLKIEEMLANVDLTRWKDTPARNFSRGMKQRLAIARAFINEPKILFLDEPFTGLDQSAVSLLGNLIGKFHSQANTMVLVTHHLEHCLAFADRVIILSKGRIGFDSPTQTMSLAELKDAYREYVG